MNSTTLIDKYAARLFMLSFCLPVRMQVWTVITLSIYLLIRSLVAGTHLAACRPGAAIWLGAPFLLLLCWLPFTAHDFVPALLDSCEHRVSVLVFPLIFAFVAPKIRNLLASEINYFVYGCIATCTAANAVFLWRYQHGAITDLTHVAYRDMFDSLTAIHPTYMGMYLCFSICTLILSPFTGTRLTIAVRSVLLLMLLMFLLALSPKAPLIALGVVLLHYAITHLEAVFRYKWLITAFTGTVAAAWFFIPFFRQRIIETVQGVEGSANADNSISMRRVIWNMDISLLRQYWLTGIGPGRLNQQLQQQYAAFAQSHAIPVPYYDTHSEYFYQWISMGLAGCILFAAVLFTHFTRAIRSRNILYLYLLIILAVTFFTETVLSMQRGVIFYAVFTSLFYFLPKANKLTE